MKKNNKKKKKNKEIKKNKELINQKIEETSLSPEEVEKREKERAKSERNKKIICLIIALVAIYFIYMIYLLVKQPTDTFTVENGELYNEETDIGYIIRDETVIKGENYANGMEQIKTEGEKAAKNESVFRYYSKNEETLKSQISALDVKIQDAMQENNSAISSDIKIVEDQIDKKIEEIRKVTDMAKLTEYKKEVDDLVTKKAKIAGELSPAGSYLKQLISQRNEYEQQLNSGAEYIKATSSGIVSYKVDGYETQLTPTNFSQITEEYLNGLDLKTGKIVATNNESGKIINNFKCYIATVSDSEDAKNSKINDSVKMRLSNNVEVNAKIVYKNQEENGKVLLIIEFSEQISELTNYRKISFELIWWKSSGLRIPNQAVIEENDLKYVVRNRAGYLSKLLIKVLRSNDKYSIVTSYTTEELRQLGFTDDEINSYKKISIYDEIMIEPDLSKVE